MKNFVLKSSLFLEMKARKSQTSSVVFSFQHIIQNHKFLDLLLAIMLSDKFTQNQSYENRRDCWRKVINREQHVLQSSKLLKISTSLEKLFFESVLSESFPLCSLVLWLDVKRESS